MQKVVKYTLDIGESPARFRLMLPQGTRWMDPAKILHICEDGDNIALWILIDDSTAVKPRIFVVLEDEQEVADNELYLGTAFIGEHTWHVFERMS